MRVSVKVWPDTKNADLLFEPETEYEVAVLALLMARKPRWGTSSRADGRVEIIFDAPK